MLAAYTTGDWDIKTGSVNSPSDWITPIPAIYSAYLFTLSQEQGSDFLVVANSNQSITMETLPESGTDSAVHATFRLILHDPSLKNFATKNDAFGKIVSFEPFDLPGMVVAHQGVGNDLVVADSSTERRFAGFRFVQGLDGQPGTVSFESESNKGCYVFSPGGDSGGRVKLRCKSEKLPNDEFIQATSFEFDKGVTEYHPISFIAKGAKRNFLMSPLISFRDESYTVYFDIRT